MSSSPTAATDEVNASCRVPLSALFVSAACWLVVYSAFAMVASIKFHSPNFLSGHACLTYGRVHAVAANALLYGFALQAGLGVALWIFARTGETPASRPWLIAAGAKLWNLGVVVGAIGILGGDTTGFENLEMPRYAAVILFFSYLMVGAWTALTLHHRRERPLTPPHWFLLAALFWFAWIYPTACLFLVKYPVRGVAQSVIAWWYSDNLNVVVLGLVGLAAFFHFIPKFAGRPLHSRYLALFTFWTWILFGSWCGIPGSAPVPAWMPALSNVAAVLTVIPLMAIGMNIFQTNRGASCPEEKSVAPWFICFGLAMFQLAGLMRAATGLDTISAVTNFTWFTVAQSMLNTYGFFAITMFGAIYYILPRVIGMEWPFARWVRLHFWLAAAGILLLVVPLAIGGVIEGFNLNNSKIAFTEIAKATLPFLRASTLGETLIFLGHLLFLGNLAGLLVRYCRARFAPIYASAIAEIEPAEAQL